jgi:hypothetical protein
MNNILEWMVLAEDPRQKAKVKHLMKDIIAIVFFAELANATEWIEIYLFAKAHEKVAYSDLLEHLMRKHLNRSVEYLNTFPQI